MTHHLAAALKSWITVGKNEFSKLFVPTLTEMYLLMEMNVFVLALMEMNVFILALMEINVFVLALMEMNVFVLDLMEMNRFVLALALFQMNRFIESGL